MSSRDKCKKDHYRGTGFYSLLVGTENVKVSHLWITLCESVVLLTETHEAFVVLAICTSIKLDKPHWCPVAENVQAAGAAWRPALLISPWMLAGWPTGKRKPWSNPTSGHLHSPFRLKQCKETPLTQQMLLENDNISRNNKK